MKWKFISSCNLLIIESNRSQHDTRNTIHKTATTTTLCVSCFCANSTSERIKVITRKIANKQTNRWETEKANEHEKREREKALANENKTVDTRIGSLLFCSHSAKPNLMNEWMNSVPMHDNWHSIAWQLAGAAQNDGAKKRIVSHLIWIGERVLFAHFTLFLYLSRCVALSTGAISPIAFRLKFALLNRSIDYYNFNSIEFI